MISLDSGLIKGSFLGLISDLCNCYSLVLQCRKCTWGCVLLLFALNPFHHAWFQMLFLLSVSSPCNWIWEFCRIPFRFYRCHRGAHRLFPVVSGFDLFGLWITKLVFELVVAASVVFPAVQLPPDSLPPATWFFFPISALNSLLLLLLLLGPVASIFSSSAILASLSNCYPRIPF